MTPVSCHLSVSTTNTNRCLAYQTRNYGAAVVFFDEHVLAALWLRALDGEDHFKLLLLLKL